MIQTMRGRNARTACRLRKEVDECGMSMSNEDQLTYKILPTNRIGNAIQYIYVLYERILVFFSFSFSFFSVFIEFNGEKSI